MKLHSKPASKANYILPNYHFPPSLKKKKGVSMGINMVSIKQDVCAKSS